MGHAGGEKNGAKFTSHPSPGGLTLQNSAIKSVFCKSALRLTARPQRASELPSYVKHFVVF